MRFVMWLALAVLATPLAGAADKPLEIVFADMEGGAAALIVTPAGESVLIDCGSRLDDQRDARRIADAARALGLEAIDHLVITHYHSDHWGGVLQLSRLIPLRRFYDHGPMAALPEDKNYAGYLADYEQACGGSRRTIRVGDQLPLNHPGSPPLSLRCVAARTLVADEPLPPCQRHERAPEDASDNARSIALVLQYGSFRAFFGGDITRNVEHDLVCPANRIGQVNLYQVDHHGLRQSNHPLLCQAIDPTVAVMLNGPRKGAHAETHAALQGAASLQAVYQLHENLADAAANCPAALIANQGAASGKPIRVTCDLAQAKFAVRCGLDGPPTWYPIRVGKAGPDSPATERAEGSYSLTPDEDGMVLKTPDGRTVLRYMTRKPRVSALTANSVCCFFPVYTPGGLRAVNFAAKDHPHHRGVFLAWHTLQGKVGADFWGWGELGPTEGRVINNRSVRLLAADAAHAVFEADNDWTALDEVMMREKLTATVRQQAGVYLLDADFQFTPLTKVTLNQTPFGGFCVKGRNDGSAYAAGPEGKIDLPIPDPFKPELNWPEKAWYDYVVTLDGGAVVGVAVVNHPGNPATTWHNRVDIAMLNPCIVAGGPLEIPEGRTLHLRYRLIVHDGPPPVAVLNDLAAQFRSSDG